ncbi:MAG TPA: hypothetical protein VKA88_02730, partial [Solirubrobacterales bacterium]|nr:hypothetical protein [Solirubrobacterales bacterium]
EHLDLGGDGGSDGTGKGSALRIAEATDFDPLGDDAEHSDETSLAIDGNPTGTGWSTEGYQDAFDKPGVGLYVDMDRQVTAGSVELRFAGGGEDVEIRSAPGQGEAPSGIDEWQLIGRESDVGTRVSIATPNARPSRFYLVWLTKLPQDPDTGEFEAEIDDIRVIGKP